MCYSPLIIKNNSTYKSSDYSQSFVRVPCGNCDECNDGRMLEWQTRICFEVDSLYKRGGVAIFLTFTYNNECLPSYDDVGFSVDCFNHDDVLSFLNRIKVYWHKLVGKSQYKYFFTSEYGHDTQRPHYHAIFFLEKSIDSRAFAESCRRNWKYGFMFPRYDWRRKSYVDNYGKCVDIEIRSLKGAAKYVSKYITKDMSYLNRDDVREYISVKANKIRMKRFLPKHWQSNGLGFCIDDYVSDDFEKCLKDGIYNPLLGRNVDLPQYYINRKIYDNVPTRGTDFERISSTTGKYLYDRVINDFGRKYYRQIFDDKIRKRVNSMSEVFQLSYDYLSKDFIALESVKNLGIDISCPPSFVNLALYYNVVSRFNNKMLNYAFMLDSGQSVYRFDYDYVYDMYLKSHDTAFLRTHSDGYVLYNSFYHQVFFKDYSLLCALYDYLRVQISISKKKEIKDKDKIIQSFRRKYMSHYPINLC